ncbi:stage II sporulation protein M [Micromonospora sp. NBC_01813]|uniref:stage II sporulation protein M n=1 Tax=Micromonospora sp. NBC_01813 TaxID=2975988 RepID=UPI002DDA3E00|nr:stage II sporulation protein M [Micromonospora sp. NBC_01813]WSA08446.1 stage II sporulation protein M [Micromonospora sp. NBC_01813]
MDLDAYVAEHEPQWRRLEQLVRGRQLSVGEVDELVALYQRTATHLSVVRSRSPDPALVARLSGLVLAARSRLTGARTVRWAQVGRFFTTDFPQAVFRAAPWWGAVAVGFCALTGFLMWWVADNPDSARLLIGDQAASELAESSFAGYYTQYAAPNFAVQLFTHNSWLAAQCLAAGILVLPVLYLLWMNALNIGVTGGVMISYDRADVFFGLITPHGLLELTGVFIAAGVGLRIGGAWISPPAHLSRSRAVAQAGLSGVLVALGLVLVFAAAGLIEAFVTPAPLPTWLRVGIGASVWLAFLGYVVTCGSRRSRRHPLS